MQERIEYRDFRVTKTGKEIDSLPGTVVGEVSEGYMERFVAEPITPNSPRGLHLDFDSYELMRQVGHIRFVRKVFAEESPFSFNHQFDGINAFSMSAQQYERRHGSSTRPPIESTSTKTPVFPCRELQQSVRFPRGFEIDGLPELLIESATGQRLSRLEKECRGGLIYHEGGNTLTLHIPFPPPDTNFTIQWRLKWQTPPAGRSSSTSLQGIAKELTGTLLALRENGRVVVSSEIWNGLGLIASYLAVTFKETFQLDHDDELDVAIMSYDERDRRLKLVAGNFPDESPAWSFSLAFGDGIAGRAYKANKPRFFVKCRAEATKTPYVYYPVDGQPGRSGIPHEALLSIPLYHPQDTETIYGVLNFGTRRASSKMIDLQDEQLTVGKFQGMNDFCFQRLHTILTTPPSSRTI